MSAEQPEYGPAQRDGRHQAHREQRQNRDQHQHKTGPFAEGRHYQRGLSQNLGEAVRAAAYLSSQEVMTKSTDLPDVSSQNFRNSETAMDSTKDAVTGEAALARRFRCRIVL